MVIGRQEAAWRTCPRPSSRGPICGGSTAFDCDSGHIMECLHLINSPCHIILRCSRFSLLRSGPGWLRPHHLPLLPLALPNHRCPTATEHRDRVSTSSTFTFSGMSSESVCFLLLALPHQLYWLLHPFAASHRPVSYPSNEKQTDLWQIACQAQIL